MYYLNITMIIYEVGLYNTISRVSFSGVKTGMLVAFRCHSSKDSLRLSAIFNSSGDALSFKYG